MPYHLNVFHIGDHTKSFDLEDFVQNLRNHDPNVLIVESGRSIKEIRISELEAGKLYFTNGLVWSIYESDLQLRKLVSFFAPLGLEIVGEEGEIYNKNTLFNFNDEPQNSSKTTDSPEIFRAFLRRNLLSLIIFCLFALFAAHTI